MGQGFAQCAQADDDDWSESLWCEENGLYWFGDEEEEDEEKEEEWVLPAGGHLTVMMFGMTGAGKSSLGNVIANSEIFGTGDDTASVTNLDSVMHYEAEDGSLSLLDTIGLGDTEINQDKVAASIRDVAVASPGGIDILLYVMPAIGRMSDDAIARLIYVVEYLWGEQKLPNLYIVVTGATRYSLDRKAGDEWIARQVELNWRFKHIYEMVDHDVNRFVFVDNPDSNSGEPQVEQRRSRSYKTMFKVFYNHQSRQVSAITHVLSRKVRFFVEEERGELDEKQRELARIQREIKRLEKKARAKDKAKAKSKAKAKAKAKAQAEGEQQKQAPQEVSTADSKIQEKLAELEQAKSHVLEAQKAMAEKLHKVKQDEAFQEEVANFMAQSLQRFESDFKNGSSEAAQAANRLFGSIGTKISEEDKDGAKSSQEAPVPGPSESSGSEMCEPKDSTANSIEFQSGTPARGAPVPSDRAVELRVEAGSKTDKSEKSSKASPKVKRAKAKSKSKPKSEATAETKQEGPERGETPIASQNQSEESAGKVRSTKDNGWSGGNPVVYLDIAVGGKKAGRIEITLRADIVPETAENFRCLCTGEKGKGASGKHLWYRKNIIHRVVKGFVIQGGDITAGNGTGGESIYGRKMNDESFALKHRGKGDVAMAGAGPNDASSQFYIALNKLESLDEHHVVFGKVTKGTKVLGIINEVGTNTEQTSRPLGTIGRDGDAVKVGKPEAVVQIIDCGQLS
eukprot:TRINITY_DN18417_c0_g1_i1.p1 TRINITY_DN18417_c0_g1~~TRINITY_DN18417_c0_g1_i1.p1  ORF type:complete len:751 (-),score=175.43 TRINITY_DN18417_c0_g1_i1:389-2605(-)